MKRILSICIVLCLVLQIAGAREMIFRRYSVKGRDPLLEKLSIQEESNQKPMIKPEPVPVYKGKTKLIFKNQSLDPLVPKLVRVPVHEVKKKKDRDEVFKERDLLLLRDEAENAFAGERFEEVDLLYSEALRRNEMIDAGAVVSGFIPEVRTRILSTIKGIKAEAENKICVRDAKNEFNRNKPVIKGIIWDEQEPSVVIGKTAYTSGDLVNNMMIVEIRKNEIEVVFSFREKKFYYTLYCE